ncbi:hypothetical protein BH10PSE17_BH10PSE17_22320 [soil metagenome]
MKRSIQLAALCAALVAAPAFAQTPATTNDPAKTMTPQTTPAPGVPAKAAAPHALTTAQKKQADADYKTAKAKCSALTSTEKKTCLTTAKADHKAALTPKGI